ncbi:MAG: hypothetical protein JW910_02150 [Anaerolineae bacterium]|nr:hypothetical protein [Anaerolineae bacterium]
MRSRLFVLSVVLVLMLGLALIAGAEEANPVTRTQVSQTVVSYCIYPAAAIPDNDPAGAAFLFSITDMGEIADANAYVGVTHTWIGDVMVDVTHVGTGTTVNLIDRIGVPAISTVGCSNNNLDVWLDDAAGAPIEDACDTVGGSTAPFPPGTYAPNGVLADLNGEDINGDWEVWISDNASLDTGTFDEFCLEFELAAAPPTEEPTEEPGEEAEPVFVQWDPGDARINPSPAMEVAIYCVADGIDLWGFSNAHYGYVSLAEFAAAPATDDAPFWTSADGTVRVYHLSDDWWGVQKDQVRGDAVETYQFAWDTCAPTATETSVYDAAGNLLVYEVGP